MRNTNQRLVELHPKTSQFARPPHCDSTLDMTAAARHHEHRSVRATFHQMDVRSANVPEFVAVDNSGSDLIFGE